jgi:mannose-6-phosphate isomerase-like protein (cupin superfamily)
MAFVSANVSGRIKLCLASVRKLIVSYLLSPTTREIEGVRRPIQGGETTPVGRECHVLGKFNRVVAALEVPAEDIGGFPGFRLRRVGEPSVDGASQLVRINHDTIAPGGGCHRHLHRQCEEIWLVLSGTGHFYCAGTLSPVRAGNCMYAEMGAPHQIINSGREPLVFMTVTVPPCDMENDVILVEEFDYERHLGHDVSEQPASV